MSELRGMRFDRKTRADQKAKFAYLYSGLGTNAANKGDLGNAERYYGKAKALSDDDGKLKIDGQMSKIYAQKYKDCVTTGPWKAESCEKKYVSKMKDYANNMKDILSNRSGDDASDDLAAFQAEYIQTFGAGMTMNYSGLGQVSQMPGSLEQFRNQTVQQYMQQQYMQQMQAQQMAMYGGNYGMMGNMALGGSSGRFLGF
jgi:hypothetical protein